MGVELPLRGFFRRSSRSMPLLDADTMTARDVCRSCGCSPAEVRRALRRGELPALYRGVYWLIHADDAQEWAISRGRPWRKYEFDRDFGNES